jgi:hypothetical protein
MRFLNEVRIFVHKRIITGVQRVEGSDGILYIILRVPWRNVIALNVHTPMKVKMPLCLTKHNSMKTSCGGVGGRCKIHIFFATALVGGGFSASSPCCLIPGEEAPHTH